ncbi:MAG: hypothetical protein IJS20_10225 [Bacteroidales bacterium]|nr:hypothetical protein [Bacteroidales bacterium]
MFHHYLIIAFRNLMRNKFQSLFTIVGLAVAFFCFGICAYFVRGLATMDQCFENRERLVELRSFRGSAIQWDKFEEAKQLLPEIEAYFRYDIKTMNLSVREGETMTLPVIECDTTLHHIFNPQLLAGSWRAAETVPNSLLLTESYAKRLYGAPDKAIGQQMTLNNQTNTITYTIQAVVENLAYNNTLNKFSDLAAWVMNDENGPRKYLQIPGYYVHTNNNRILLRKGVKYEDFVERLKNAKIVAYDDNKTKDYGTPYIEASQPFDIKEQFVEYYYFIIVISIILLPGLLILLSALSNFFHLLISSIMLRQREYALRRAHGAQTRDLWLMLSVQIIITMLLVGGCTLLIIKLCTGLFDVRAYSSWLVLDTDLMLWQSAQHIVVLLLVGFLVAWLAVVRSRRHALQESMKSSSGRRPGTHHWRNILMGVQMTIGFLFLIIISVLVLVLHSYETSQVPWLTMDEKKSIINVPEPVIINSNKPPVAVAKELRDEFAALPCVQEAILNPNFDHWFRPTGSVSHKYLNANGDTIMANNANIYSQHLDLLNVPLLDGRLPECYNEILVDQLFYERHHIGVGEVIKEYSVNYFPPEQPDGPNIKSESYIAFTIVGIIDNLVTKTRENNGYNRVDGVYHLYDLDQGSCNVYNILVKCLHGHEEEAKQAITEIMLQHKYWRMRRNMYSLDYMIREDSFLLRQFTNVFWIFAVIAIVLTLLSVYSAITMDTTARRKEMAIRKINGAKTHHIILWFSRLYLILLGVSAAITFPLTYIIFNEMNVNGNIIYRETKAYDPLFYLGILLCMALFVALTIGAQIWRISRIQPAEVVKSE